MWPGVKEAEAEGQSPRAPPGGQVSVFLSVSWITEVSPTSPCTRGQGTPHSPPAEGTTQVGLHLETLSLNRTRVHGVCGARTGVLGRFPHACEGAGPGGRDRETVTLNVQVAPCALSSQAGGPVGLSGRRSQARLLPSRLSLSVCLPCFGNSILQENTGAGWEVQ